MNFQNIPRDDKVIKTGIVPKLGALSFFDYSAIEPRLFAYYTAKLGNPELAKAVAEGLDPYTTVARFITEKDTITPAERQIWKRIFLAVLYGAGAKRVRQVWLEDMGKPIPYAKAKAMKEAVEDNLPGYQELQEMVAHTVRRRGYILGIDGRRLHQEPYGEHKMVNKLIQGSAAAIMTQAIVRVHTELENGGLWGIRSHIISVVHDDLWIDGPEQDLPWLTKNISQLMIHREVNEVVPVEVEHQVSTTNAAEKKPYETR
jgi:DNA polymerase-1